MICQLRNLAAVFALLAIPGIVQAQDATTGITGRIVERASARPLGDVQIQVVGTNLGARTDAEGRYTIRGVPAGPQSLRANRIGFQEARVPVVVTEGTLATANFEMQAAALVLTEVVTTATGQESRASVGQSIAQIDASKAVQQQPIANMGDLLNNRAPGVQVLQGTTTGAGSRVRIRGTSSLSLSNDPIYIIDGIRMTSNSNSIAGGVGGTTPSRVNDLNPEDIELIEVIKGPSAATLYGTDAANGVIVITTKRGRTGKTAFTGYGEQGWITDRNPYPTAYTIFGHTPGSITSRTDCTLTQVSTGGCVVDSVSSLNLREEDDLTPIGTGYRSQYGLQASGGSEAVRFFASGELEEETGVLKLPAFERRRFESTATPIQDEWDRPNHMRRASFRGNLNATLTRKADLNISTGFIRSYLRLPQADNNTTGLQSSFYGGPGYRNNGVGSNLTPRNGYRAYTPGYMFQETYSQDVSRFIGSSDLNFRPATWSTNRATLGVDFTQRADNDLCRLNNCSNFGTNRLGFKSAYRTNFYNYTANLSSTAEFQIRDWLNSRTTLGTQYVNYQFQTIEAETENLSVGTQTLNAGSVPDVGEGTTYSRTLGFFIEQKASMNERLFLTLGLRNDQNSAFGNDFQSVFYPKAEVSWIVSDESFFPRPTWVSQLRLRGAYGAAGNQPGPNDALAYLAASTTNIDRQDAPAVLFQTLGNSDLRPERATETEAGFEALFLDERLRVDFTYYSKLSKDALIARIQPPSAGVPPLTRLENLGAVKNAGVELLLSARPVDYKPVAWEVTFNGSRNDNKLVSLGDVPAQIGNTIRNVAGHPLNGWWQRRIRSYNDRNNDGILTRDEVVVDDSASFIGYSQPRYEAALTNSVDLLDRALRLSLLVDYKGGYITQNGTERIRCQSRNNCLGGFSQGASLEEQARSVALREDPSRTQVGYMEDGTFYRLREISVSYSVPQSLLRGLPVTPTLVLAGRNLYTWTKYTGIDPESNYGQDDVQNNFQASPTPTYYIVRLNVGF